MVLLFDLPTHDQLDKWQKIKVLIALPGKKKNFFDDTASKEDYLNNGFKECRIGVAKEYTQSLKNNMQGKRKKYGLKPYVSSTIHGAMGDTLQYMAT